MTEITVDVPDGKYCLDCQFIDSINKQTIICSYEETKICEWNAKCRLFDMNLNGNSCIQINKCSECHNRSMCNE